MNIFEHLLILVLGLGLGGAAFYVLSRFHYIHDWHVVEVWGITKHPEHPHCFVLKCSECHKRKKVSA